MRNKRKSKKGFTLMELSIVIALVAIVSVAAIGVCTLVSNITYENTVKNEIIQETTLLKKQVASWVDNYFEEHTINDVVSNIKAHVEDTFTENKEDFDRIDNISFNLTSFTDDYTKFLWTCTVTLKNDYPFSEDNKTFIFTVTKG